VSVPARDSERFPRFTGTAQMLASVTEVTKRTGLSTVTRDLESENIASYRH